MGKQEKKSTGLLLNSNEIEALENIVNYALHDELDYFTALIEDDEEAEKFNDLATYQEQLDYLNEDSVGKNSIVKDLL